MLARSLLALIIAAVSLATPALADTGATDCSDWGTITPDVRDTYFGEFVTFRVAGGRACGDVDTCSWWTDGNQGDFLQTTGSPVTWRAPEDTEECVSLEFRLWASCTDGNTTGFADVTVRCTHEQLANVQASRNAVVTGGGCSGPGPTDASGGTTGGTTGAGLLLLPALGLGGAWLGRRRR